MKLILTNKFFSIGGSSVVKDESDNPVYKIKGRIFSITKVKKIFDMDGKLLFKVRNKWFNFFAHYAHIFDADGNKVASVKDKWINLKNQYFIIGYKDEIQVDGELFSFSATVLKNGQPIGTIRRRINFVDQFEIEAEEGDMPFLVAIVVAMDNIQDKKSDERS